MFLSIWYNNNNNQYDKTTRSSMNIENIIFLFKKAIVFGKNVNTITKIGNHINKKQKQTKQNNED